MESRTNIKIREDVTWAVDLYTIKVFFNNEMYLLNYPQAAIWDFISRGYTILEITDKLKHIAFVNEKHAKAIIDNTLKELHDKALISIQ